MFWAIYNYFVDTKTPMVKTSLGQKLLLLKKRGNQPAYKQHDLYGPYSELWSRVNSSSSLNQTEGLECNFGLV